MGILFDKNGINWEKHFEERRLKAMAALGRMRDLGLNGNGFNLNTNSRPSKAFIQPVADYGIQICPITSKRKALNKATKSILRNLVPFSKTISIETLYLLSIIDSPKLRYEKLR